jgi:beta-galactosidase
MQPSKVILAYCRSIQVLMLICIVPLGLIAQSSPREKVLMDRGWRFSFGHPSDKEKDFNYGQSVFSSFAKAGFGDGPASPGFDDRAWRKLDLPHDWAVEAPFDPGASHSHGYKAAGKNFPERSIGWYRKTFVVPKSDEGKRISINFEGVFRNSTVWINGHYLGVEPSGYSSFQYNLTEYLNYGGDNVVVVRVDASMEEGWFYEGAGIYRHVWLTKTSSLHVQHDGTFVSSEIKNNNANITIRTTVVNDGMVTAEFTLHQTLYDNKGTMVDSVNIGTLAVRAGESKEFVNRIELKNPTRWSLENPYLYRAVTTVSSNGKISDVYATSFGIREVRWDPNTGFHLNGTPIKLQGTNNHQDHAGVGAALPDELQRFRIMKLKEMGCNAYRCSHHPPSPELLKACDELGMLVIDENRLMGTSDPILKELKRMIVRDRNHPSVILWSLGNEEWAIEGNETGARIASTMQAYAHRLDSTRLTTVAVSGGWGNGISRVIDVMGYNYISHGSTDQQHQKFPQQAGVGTEEGATFSTRGVYEDDKEKRHLNAYDWDPTDWGAGAEEAWTYYNMRKYLSGMFIWSGFDYRGEPTPFDWPAIASQFGVLDLCGFPKDNAFYYKSWWTSTPMVHLFPHWNWKKGQSVKVWSYSNCDEVELFLNGKSLGKKKVNKDSHAEWIVTFSPGKLVAQGYKNGKKAALDAVHTTAAAKTIQMQPHKTAIKADNEDLAIITVSTLDERKQWVPDADSEIRFTIDGPGRIIGVGNGNPSSIEPDRYIDSVAVVNVSDWTMKQIDSKASLAGILETNDAAKASDISDNHNEYANLYRGTFNLNKKSQPVTVTMFLAKNGPKTNVFLNGKLLKRDTSDLDEILIAPSLLKEGRNTLAIVTKKSNNNSRPGNELVTIQIRKQADQWKRKLFNGLAQVIIQSTGEPGEIVLKAASNDLKGEVKIPSRQTPTLMKE